MTSSQDSNLRAVSPIATPVFDADNIVPTSGSSIPRLQVFPNTAALDARGRGAISSADVPVVRPLCINRGDSDEVPDPSVDANGSMFANPSGRSSVSVRAGTICYDASRLLAVDRALRDYSLAVSRLIKVSNPL